MTTDQHQAPLFGDVPKSVRLDNAPLARVSWCVKFARISKIEVERYIAEFQEAIREKYPRFERGVAMGVDVAVAGGTVEPRPVSSVLWRLSDATNSFRVILGADSVILDTNKYVSRDDFLSRFEFVLNNLGATIRPSLVEEVSVKYLDRLTNADDLEALPSLINERLLNVLHPPLVDNIELSMSEITGRTEEGRINARFGLLPPNFSHEPSVIEPIDRANWLLDVTATSKGCDGKDFDAIALTQELSKAAARAYAFFRWSVTKEFLNRFGATNTPTEDTS